jgi:hypothetical protein
MSVGVQTTPTFRAGTPSKLFDGPFYVGVNPRTYDIAPDGQRFLMIKNQSVDQPNTPPASLTVVEHWTEELKQKVPTK